MNNETFDSIPYSYADYLNNKPENNSISAKNEKNEKSASKNGKNEKNAENAKYAKNAENTKNAKKSIFEKNEKNAIFANNDKHSTFFAKNSKFEKNPIKIIDLYSLNLVSNEDAVNFPIKVSSKSRYSSNESDFSEKKPHIEKSEKNGKSVIFEEIEEFTIENQRFYQESCLDHNPLDFCAEIDEFPVKNEEFATFNRKNKEESNKKNATEEDFTFNKLQKKEIVDYKLKLQEKTNENLALLKKIEKFESEIENLSQKLEKCEKCENFKKCEKCENFKKCEKCEIYKKCEKCENFKKCEKPSLSSQNTETFLLLEKNQQLSLELDSVILELKQVKMEWALTVEIKEETEVSLKNEIKSLLNKLIQAKNPPSDDHSRNFSMNLSNFKENLKESILSRTSRSRSPSIYKPPASLKKIQRKIEAFKTEEFEECEAKRKCEILTTRTMKDLNKM